MSRYWFGLGVEAGSTWKSARARHRRLALSLFSIFRGLPNAWELQLARPGEAYLSVVRLFVCVYVSNKRGEAKTLVNDL